MPATKCKLFPTRDTDQFVSLLSLFLSPSVVRYTFFFFHYASQIGATRPTTSARWAVQARQNKGMAPAFAGAFVLYSSCISPSMTQSPPLTLARLLKFEAGAKRGVAQLGHIAADRQDTLQKLDKWSTMLSPSLTDLRDHLMERARGGRLMDDAAIDRSSSRLFRLPIHTSSSGASSYERLPSLSFLSFSRSYLFFGENHLGLASTEVQPP